MTENASNSFSRKNEKKMLVFPKNAPKNASIIEKGLVVAVDLSKAFDSGCFNICADCEISQERVRLANAL